MFVIALHAYEKHGGAILAGCMECVCHTVNTDLKVANVCDFL